MKDYRIAVKSNDFNNMLEHNILFVLIYPKET